MNKLAAKDWKIISRNERVVTYEGRHFFAFRCRPNTPWRLREMDRDILAGDGAREVKHIRNVFNTRELSGQVMTYVNSQEWSAVPVIATHPARRVRYVRCPTCGTITPKDRNQPGDQVSITACRCCHYVFAATHQDSWLAHPGSSVSGEDDV